MKNDLGHDAAAMCQSFPELKGVLEKRERKMKLRVAKKMTGAVEVLGKRISTAIPIQHLRNKQLKFYNHKKLHSLCSNNKYLYKTPFDHER